MQTMISGEDKPVLVLEGVGPDVVLNKSNLRAIESVLGTESDDWSGHEVEISKITVQFQGRATPGICVTVIEPEKESPKPPESSPPPRRSDMDDEIPF
jgi:hypothetical protein